MLVHFLAEGSMKRLIHLLYPCNKCKATTKLHVYHTERGISPSCLISFTGSGRVHTAFSDWTTFPRPWLSWMIDTWVCSQVNSVTLFWHVIRLHSKPEELGFEWRPFPIVTQVKLLGIDASGIADGVPSVVLNLVWIIVLHFQVVLFVYHPIITLGLNVLSHFLTWKSTAVLSNR